MNGPKTRVNFSMLPKHAGQYVCVVGKNLGVSSLVVNLEKRSVLTYDKGYVTW